MTPDVSYTWEQVISWDLKIFLEKARTLSWKTHGERLQCFIPGQMVYIDEKGKYPAISLTGTGCALHCDHCHGRILDGMIPAREPYDLQELCRELDTDGNIGVLLSGAASRNTTGAASSETSIASPVIAVFV